MKSSSRRPGWYRVLLALSFGGALGCTPAVNIGDLPQASTGATSTGGSSSGEPPSSGTACGVITTLASGLKDPAVLARQGDSLYVMTSAQITGEMPAGTGILYRVPVAGGSPVVLATGQSQPLGIVTDATSVYWTTSDGMVKKMPLAGGSITVLASGQTSLGRMAIDSTSLYWGTWVSESATLMRMPLAGGAPTTLFDAATIGASGGIAGVALDASNAYVTIDNTTPGGNADGRVVKVPLDGGAPVVLAAGLPDPQVIVVDAENVYWGQIVNYVNLAMQLPGSVMKLPLDGSSPPVTLATQKFPVALALDGSTLYASGGMMVLDMLQPQNASPVNRISLDEGGAEAIVPSIVSVGLAVCPGGLCWTDMAHGTVMRFEACSP